MKNETNAAEYVSNRNVIVAEPGQLVIVFEFWHVSGALKRQCVPYADSYNLIRLRGHVNWYEVGVGMTSKLSDVTDEWGNQHWIIDWRRAYDPPPCPYTRRWRVLRKIRRAADVARIALRGQWSLAWRLIKRGYIFGKSELVFVKK